eukprot:6205802-Pleurochrysis_carterae.AAC.1
MARYSYRARAACTRGTLASARPLASFAHYDLAQHATGQRHGGAPVAACDDLHHAVPLGSSGTAPSARL